VSRIFKKIFIDLRERERAHAHKWGRGRGRGNLKKTPC